MTCSALRFLPLFALLLTFATSQTQNITCNEPDFDCDDPSIDQFPEDMRIKIEHANKTIPSITYFTNFVDVDISSDNEKFRYRFVVCGCSTVSAAGRQIIFINPRAFYIEESPTLALYQLLAPESISRIKAVQNRDFIFDSNIRNLISNGAADEVTSLTTFQIDYDKVKDAKPNLSIIGAFNVDGYREANLDIPFLVALESQEQNPLARAEWIKLMGLVLGRPDKANKEFGDIEKRYNDAKRKAREAIRRPAVVFNHPFAIDRDADTVDERYTWTQPVRDEYMTQFISDANADFRYMDERPEPGRSGRSLNMSTIVRDFKSADYLIRSSNFPGRNDRSLQDYLGEMVSIDDPDPEARKEVEKLKAVRCANVWSIQKQITPDGKADDFFESGIIRPDEILSDFIQALHPYLDFPNRETVFSYRYEDEKPENASQRCPFTVLNGTAPEGFERIDTKFNVPRLNRFQIADMLEDKVLPAIKERISEPFEVFFHHEDVSEPQTVVTVRVQVREANKGAFESNRNLVRGMMDALGNEVRERSDDGSELPPPQAVQVDDGGGGLSGGAIAGIIIAVIAAALLVAFIIFKRKSRSRVPIQAQAPQSAEYWDDPETGPFAG